jgi:hypothetical protein
MTVSGGEDADTSGVLTGSDVYLASDLELDETDRSVGLEVNLDRVEDLCVWVWVSQGFTVVGDNEWDCARGKGGLDDLSELVLCFLGRHLHWDVSALCVVEKSEVLVGLWDGDNVCRPGERETETETEGESMRNQRKNAGDDDVLRRGCNCGRQQQQEEEGGC